MNEAWTKIFKGAQGIPPNLEFLDGTLATIRQLSVDGEDIVIDEEHILKASKLLKRKLLILGNDDEDAWLDLEVGVPQ